MNEDTITIKTSDLHKLIETLEFQSTKFFLQRMPANRNANKCGFSMASELVGFQPSGSVLTASVNLQTKPFLYLRLQIRKKEIKRSPPNTQGVKKNDSLRNQN